MCFKHEMNLFTDNERVCEFGALAGLGIFEQTYATYGPHTGMLPWLLRIIHLLHSTAPS